MPLAKMAMPCADMVLARDAAGVPTTTPLARRGGNDSREGRGGKAKPIEFRLSGRGPSGVPGGLVVVAGGPSSVGGSSVFRGDMRRRVGMGN